MLPLPATCCCCVSGAPGAVSLVTAKVPGTETATRACRREGTPRVRPPRLQRQQEVQRDPGRLGWLAPPLLAAVLALSSHCFVGAPASAGQIVDVSASQKGAALFQKACIGCHDAGGNILQPGATLFTRDLERNGSATEEEIYNITYFGKGRMPGFGEKCTPRGRCTFGPRLQEDEIKQLAEFVRSQADRGWPKLDVYGD